MLVQAAHALAVNAGPTADKLSKSVVGAAEQAGEQAKPNADKAEKLLRDNAQKLAHEAPARADEVRTPCPDAVIQGELRPELLCLPSAGAGGLLRSGSSYLQV